MRPWGKETFGRGGGVLEEAPGRDKSGPALKKVGQGETPKKTKLGSASGERGFPGRRGGVPLEN